MRPYKLLAIIAGLCSILVSAVGQTNDWRFVESLAPGTPISVVKRVRSACDFVNANNGELTCERALAGRARRLVFERAQVREVRLEVPEQNHLIEGAVVGAIMGGLLGCLGGNQLADPEARGYARLYGIPIGAFVGRVAGQKIHRHGAVVYRRR